MFEMADAEMDALDVLARGPRPGWEGPLRVTGSTDDDLAIEPLWDLVDDDAVVVADATPEEALDAWEHAATWTQSDLDRSEQAFRVADAARTRRLLTAYRAALQDLTQRYGPAQGHRGSQGVQLFFAQTGLALGMHPVQVAHRIDTADVLVRRLPTTWARYRDGTAPWRAVDLAVAAAEGMAGDDAWAAYDERVAAALAPTGYEPQDAPAVSSLPRRFRTIREDVQRDTMIERARRTRERRTTTIEHHANGESTLAIVGPTVLVTAMDAVIHAAAVAAHGLPDEDRGVGQLRFDIAADLIIEGAKTAADPDSPAVAVPGRKGVNPTVVVTVPALSLLGRSAEPARIKGIGPMDLDTARRYAADAPSFFRLLTHPITGVRLDLDRKTYVPPADLRRWVKVRDETCRFPGCDRPAHRCDIDHAMEWQHGGITEAANLVTLCRPHHNGKSTGLTAEQLRPDDGVDWPLPWRQVADPPPLPFDPAPDDCPF